MEKEMDETIFRKEYHHVNLTPADMLLDKEEFQVNFLALDNRNYVYVQTVSKKHFEWYSKMEYMMSRELESSSGCITFCDLEVKKMVMLRISGKYEDKLFRVRILDVPDIPTERVRVLQIDYFQEHMARITDLFDLPEDSSIALTPPFAVKCVLDGIELLLGINCIQNSEEMRGLMERGNRQYTAKILSVNKPTGIPKICMWDSQGRFLSSKIHQMLPTVCQVKLPPMGELADDVTITYADSKGFIWLQYRNKKLVDRIQGALEYFDEKHYADSALLEKEVPVIEAWKHFYYSGSSAVFITKFEGSYYRCRLKRALEDQHYEIEYIDYGNRDIKEHSELVLAYTFDENLCFIPPQCVKVHLLGKSTCLDVEKFWTKIYSIPASRRLMVKIMSDSVDCPEVEAFEGIIDDNTFAPEKSFEQDMNSSSRSDQESDKTLKFLKIRKLNFEEEIEVMDERIEGNHNVNLTPSDMLLDKEEFCVNFVGMDNRNYIYVQTVSKKHSDWYSDMEYMMSRVVESSSGCIPYSELAGKEMVILRVRRKYEDKLFRVRILDAPENPTGRVRVLKIDKCQEHMARITDLFDLSTDSAIFLTPPFAVRCVLQGIEFLLGINCIQNSEEMRRLMERGSRQYTAKTLSVNQPTGIPKIRMWDSHGRLLASKFHQTLPTVCKVKLARLGEMMTDNVTITHANSKGFIWMQYRNKKLVDRIQEALEYFEEKNYSNSAVLENVDSALLGTEIPETEAWKHFYYSGPNAVFITKFEGSYYRCKLKRALEGQSHFLQQYEVEYIDYGNRDIKEHSELFPAYKFDENLCFIPPQCVRVHLNGKSTLDVADFWDHIYSVTSKNSLIIRIVGDGVDCPEVEAFEGSY